MSLPKVFVIAHNAPNTPNTTLKDDYAYVLAVESQILHTNLQITSTTSIPTPRSAPSRSHASHRIPSARIYSSLALSASPPTPASHLKDSSPIIQNTPNTATPPQRASPATWRCVGMVSTYADDHIARGTICFAISRSILSCRSVATTVRCDEGWIVRKRFYQTLSIYYLAMCMSHSYSSECESIIVFYFGRVGHWTHRRRREADGAHFRRFVRRIAHE